MRAVKTWHHEILRHSSSWMCPVTTTNSLPVLLRACSAHAPLCPSSWPPQKHVSICLASPAMTQHWLNTRIHTHIFRYTLPLCIYLWGLGCLCSQGFPFLFILFVPLYEVLQMCVDSCLLYFYLNWGPKGKQKKANTVLYLLFCSYPGPLTSA